MNPNSLIRNRRDRFVALRNPFASRWSTLALVPVDPARLAVAMGASPDDADPDDEDLDDEDDDDFDDDDASDDDEEAGEV